MKEIKWNDTPKTQDYSAAFSYLSLLCDPILAAKLVDHFRSAVIIDVKAKDVIRAAGLSLLSKDNFHVHRDLKKIEESIPLSPILLVRGNGARSIPLVIADGYHRTCAIYVHSEDSDIKARIVDWV